MKKFFCWLSFLLLAGCAHKSGVNPFGECPTAETISHFPWIGELIKNHPNSNACALIVYEGSYNGETVIYWDYRGPACDTAGPVQLFSCKGELIMTFTTSEDFIARNSSLKQQVVLVQ